MGPHIGVVRFPNKDVAVFRKDGPNNLTPKSVKAAIGAGKLHELLGFPVSREEAVARTQPPFNEHGVAVVERAHDGTEARAAAATHATAAHQASAMEGSKLSPENTISAESPERVMAGRGLEPVDHDPFAVAAPDRTMRRTDLDRAKGFPEPRSPMHDRIMAASRHGFQTGGGLQSEEEDLQRQREIGTASGSDLGPTSPVRSPGLFGGARPVQPSAQFGASAEPVTPPVPASPAEESAPLRYNDPAFAEGRIATRTPSAVGAADPHLSNEARIGLDTMQAHPPTYAKTANVARQMPFVKSTVETDDGPKVQWNPTGLHNIPETATSEEAHQALVAHWKSNILALHDAVPDEIRPGSMLWYDGANARAAQKAVTYNRPVENTAGVYAALSPQKDWFENVSLGDRVMDVMHNQQNTPFTPEMWTWARSAIKDPDDLATLRSMRPTKGFAGRTLGAINDPHGQALWVRAYDEAHNPRDYNIVNPDGTFGPTATNTNGSNSRVAWGSFDAIEKAVKAFNAPNMPAISQAMGDRHKVRNFYNNIVAPNSEHGDVTIDTHAIAGVRTSSRWRARTRS